MRSGQQIVYQNCMDGISQMIDFYQCATVQEITLRTHACFFLQYADSRTITAFPSILVVFVCKRIA